MLHKVEHLLTVASCVSKVDASSAAVALYVARILHAATQIQCLSQRSRH
jgi:hypothetical protein